MQLAKSEGCCENSEPRFLPSLKMDCLFSNSATRREGANQPTPALSTIRSVFQRLCCVSSDMHCQFTLLVRTWNQLLPEVTVISLESHCRIASPLESNEAPPCRIQDQDVTSFEAECHRGS